jgi:hypothetical protein
MMAVIALTVGYNTFFYILNIEIFNYPVKYELLKYSCIFYCLYSWLTLKEKVIFFSQCHEIVR